MAKISVNIDDRVLEFLDRTTDNRSKYINDLIAKEKQKAFEDELRAAYRDQENDPEFHQEVEAWDCVAGDGLDDSVDGAVLYL